MLINTGNSPVAAITTILASIGAINWGLVALFDFNLVFFLLGMSVLAKIVYLLVAASGLYCLATVGKFLCKPSIETSK